MTKAIEMTTRKMLEDSEIITKAKTWELTEDNKNERGKCFGRLEISSENQEIYQKIKIISKKIGILLKKIRIFSKMLGYLIFKKRGMGKN